MTEEVFIPKIKWSEFEYYHPIRIRIIDWSKLEKIYFGRYMVVPSAMEYKGREITLCVPYDLFIRLLRKLPLEKQRWITDGKAVLEIVKTFKKDNFGMIIKKVELYTPE